MLIMLSDKIRAKQIKEMRESAGLSLEEAGKLYAQEMSGWNPQSAANWIKKMESRKALCIRISFDALCRIYGFDEQKAVQKLIDEVYFQSTNN